MFVDLESAIRELAPKLICNACLFLLLGVPLVLGQAALEKRTSLDVNAVPPADVFGSLAQALGCGLEIDPGIKTPVTLSCAPRREIAAPVAETANAGLEPAQLVSPGMRAPWCSWVP